MINIRGIIIILIVSIGCQSSDDFVYINCNTLKIKNIEVDSIPYAVIEEAMVSTIGQYCILLTQSHDVLLSKNELMNAEYSPEFQGYEFMDIITQFPELIDNLNLVNYQRSLRYGFLQQFPFFIEQDEWDCINDNYHNNEDVWRAAETLVGNSDLFAIVQSSLPGFSNRKEYALIAVKLVRLKPKDERGIEDFRFIIVKRDEVSREYKYHLDVWWLGD